MNDLKEAAEQIDQLAEEFQDNQQIHSILKKGSMKIRKMNDEKKLQVVAANESGSDAFDVA